MRRHLVALALAPALALFVSPRLAAAAETQSLAEESRAYYAGEKNVAYLFAAIGITSVAAGGALLYRGSDFAKGLGASFLTLGALQAAGATFYSFQVEAQAAHFGALFASDPAAFQREELTHIHGTTSRFVLYRLSELGLAIVGASAATYGFAANKDAWKGAGLGVAGQGTLFLVIDSFGASRAHAYEDHVRAFAPALTIAPDLRGASAGVSARF